MNCLLLTGDSLPMIKMKSQALFSNKFKRETINFVVCNCCENVALEVLHVLKGPGL